MYKKERFYKVTIATLLLLLFVVNTPIYSQRVAVSTNLVEWATISPNIEVEVTLKEHISLSMQASCNPFNKITNNLKFKHITLSTEARYWFEQPLYAHYLGVNFIASDYNISTNKYATMGRLAGVGVGYGYSFILGNRLNLTPNIGVGYGYISSYEYDDLGSKVNKTNGFKPIITQFGVRISYIIN
ncbi:MAG: DUF3575 domain-containing protein [Rikenellaceae bacterium]